MLDLGLGDILGKLSGWVCGGLFAAACTLLALDRYAVLPLAPVHPLAWSVAAICAVVFGCLFLFSALSWSMGRWERASAARLIRKRRQEFDATMQTLKQKREAQLHGDSINE
ncbi:MAG: hypothetical protein ACOYB4_02540 [Methyloceanibacter sp.]